MNIVTMLFAFGLKIASIIFFLIILLHFLKCLRFLDSKQTLKIHAIGTSLLGKSYSGFGKIEVYCTGEGDNYTKSHWIVTADTNGQNETVNTTNFEFHGEVVWKTLLVYRPNIIKETYIYKCVVENKCCETQTKVLKIPYTPPIFGNNHILLVITKNACISPFSLVKNNKSVILEDENALNLL